MIPDKYRVILLDATVAVWGSPELDLDLLAYPERNAWLWALHNWVSSLVKALYLAATGWFPVQVTRMVSGEEETALAVWRELRDTVHKYGLPQEYKGALEALESAGRKLGLDLVAIPRS